MWPLQPSGVCKWSSQQWITRDFHRSNRSFRIQEDLYEVLFHILSLRWRRSWPLPSLRRLPCWKGQRPFPCCCERCFTSIPIKEGFAQLHHFSLHGESTPKGFSIPSCQLWDYNWFIWEFLKWREQIWVSLVEFELYRSNTGEVRS